MENNKHWAAELSSANEIDVLKIERHMMLEELKNACCALTSLNQDTSELNKLIIEIELNSK